MSTIETVKIAVTRPDGCVSIMAYVVVGRGSMLPDGAQWLDKAAGRWARPAIDSLIAAEVERACPGAVGWQRVADEQVPADREFRDALTLQGDQLVHDMGKARVIVRSNIRHARAQAFPGLDGQYSRAFGQGNKKEAGAVEATRQAWRDAPADPRIEAAQTLDELKAIANPG